MRQIGGGRWIIAWAEALLLLSAFVGFARAAQAITPRVGLYETHFASATPLADIGEILKRCLSKAGYTNQAAHGFLSGQVIGPVNETWQVYVPESYDGSQAFGVLVWVEPMDELRFPQGWQGILQQRHVIYVSAAKSGNDQDVYSRRIPLALTGLANIEALYKIDPARIYIGGFSGGGATASLIAAAYADVFTGGIFVATSYGIGSQWVPVPPPDRLKLMQSRGRYVFLVGSEDPVNESITDRAESAYKQFCVLRIKNVLMWNKGHTNLNPGYLNYALNFLDSPNSISAEQQATCDRSLGAE